MIEVIATCIDDAMAIERYGGQRIELSSALSEMGITPSFGLIKNVAKKAKIPVHVIIRPHSKSFVYSAEDIEVMKDDIKVVKELGADGIVIGLLDDKYNIDEKNLEVLLIAGEGMDITFHRAIDLVEDQVEAVRVLQKYPQIVRIVTAGGEGKVMDNLDIIRDMVQASEGKTTIMLGGGLNKDNVKQAVEATGAQEVHFGTGVRENHSHIGDISEELMGEVIGEWDKVAR